MPVWRFSRLSVRTQLMLLLVAVLVPVLGVMLYHLAHGRQIARDFAYERVRILAHTTAGGLGNLLRDHEAVLRRIAQRPMVMALDGQACDPIIVEFVKLYPEFTNLVVQDLAGRNDCSYLSQKITREQLSGIPGFRDAISRSTMTVGDAALGPLSGRWISVLFYPVKDIQGRTTGLISLPMDLVQLGERILGSLPRGALVVVLDQSGTIVLRSRDAPTWIGRPVPVEMTHLATAQAEGSVLANSADGVQRLFAVAPVERAGWSVLAGVPVEEVFADANAAFASGILWVLGILVLALGLAWRIGRGIVRPIDALSLAASHVADGQTSTRVQLDSAPRELWAVAWQFNHMLDARERAQSELRESEERFRTLARLSSDWYWEQDADYRFVRFDGRVLDGTGISSEGYVGKTRWELPALNLTQDDWARHRALLDARQEFRHFEILRLGPDGRERWGAVSGTPIFDTSGRFCGYRGVGTDITEPKRLEQERLRLSLHIEELSRRMVQAQEEIRRRFSRELHDRTSPNLAALRINLDMITRASPAERSTEEFAGRVEDTRALIEDTTLSVREICAELHPPVIDCGGLLAVVQSYAQQFARRTGLQVNVECQHGEVRLAHDLELALFRIVQEALTNSAKHAQARTLTVLLQLDSCPVMVMVTDDGVGFDVEKALKSRHMAGLGLINMRETAEFAGGSFTLQSAPGHGTRICVEI